MKIIRKMLICILIFSYFTGLSGAAENEYGIVKAWFNGKPATVEGISMKIGETAEIKVNATSKIDGNIYVLLDETGVTHAFDVVNGPSMMGQWIDNLNVEKNWSKEFIWIVKVNGRWVNGNAPINILVQFSKKGIDKKAEFSVANPYILNERFSGALPTQTPSVSPAASPPSSSSPRSTPGFELLLAFCALAGACLLARR